VVAIGSQAAAADYGKSRKFERGKRALKVKNNGGVFGFFEKFGIVSIFEAEDFDLMVVEVGLIFGKVKLGFEFGPIGEDFGTHTKLRQFLAVGLPGFEGRTEIFHQEFKAGRT